MNNILKFNLALKTYTEQHLSITKQWEEAFPLDKSKPLHPQIFMYFHNWVTFCREEYERKNNFK